MRDITVEDLQPGSSIRDVLEFEITGWLPNYVNAAGHITDYEELLDRVDGLKVGDFVLDLGSSTISPLYVTVQTIARQIAKETREG